MHDAARVAVVERVGDLDPDVDDVAEAQRLLPEQARQVRSADDRHHEEERALVPPEVVDRDDGGVVHLPDDLRLPLEALLELGREIRRGDELDGDFAVQDRVAGPVDDPHPAAAELAEDFVAVRKPRVDHANIPSVGSRGPRRRSSGSTADGGEPFDLGPREGVDLVVEEGQQQGVPGERSSTLR